MGSSAGNSNWEVVEYASEGGSHKALLRTFTFDDFAGALAFVNSVGALAEEYNHHPDIALSWGRVKVWLSTHSERGITDKDYVLARAIDDATSSY